ncbi:MFS transporter [candidate division WOR-3 bacterium]|jgi:MFS family permease|nr:MFS transporter [candidate division WOR-3 bacterium]
MKPEKLFNKNLILLWQGQFISLLGTEIVTIVVILWLKENTGLATLMGLSTALFTLSTVIFSPLGGSFADRHSRKLIIVSCDLIGGLTNLLLFVILLINKELILLNIICIILAQVILGTIGGFFEPAVFASIPDIVPKNKIESANSLKGITQHLSALLGNSVGGLLFVIFHTPFLFLFNGISYILSALSEMFMTIPQAVKEHKDGRNKNIFKNIKEGLIYIWGKKGLRSIILSITLVNFFSTPFIIILPYFLEDRLKIGIEWYGYILGIYSAGSIFGFILTSIIKIPKKLRFLILTGGMILFGLLLMSIGFINDLFPLICISISLGIIFAFINVISETTILINTSSSFRGRIFGITSMLSTALVPLGMLLSGIIFDLIRKNLFILFFGLGVLFLISIFFVFGNKDVNKYISYET